MGGLRAGVGGSWSAGGQNLLFMRKPSASCRDCPKAAFMREEGDARRAAAQKNR